MINPKKSRMADTNSPNQRKISHRSTPGPEPRDSIYSVITVDCPEISNRLRQRMFLQAITSSLRTI